MFAARPELYTFIPIVEERIEAASNPYTKNKRSFVLAFSEWHLQNYVIWKEEGLYLRFTKCDDELKVNASELPKTFYGDYVLRDLPVKLYYKDDYELEILMKACPYPWYLMPGDIPLGRSCVGEHWNNMKNIGTVARTLYFTGNGRIFCTTLGMGWKGKCIEVDLIRNCPQSYYDIAERIYKLDVEIDLELERALRNNKGLARRIGKPLRFLDRTLQP
ncbi:hypothetical protein Cantr_01101 [Candida viswanathii]|uniref:Uncharacterized protein n=1 Tax=Candida viswanathii TaxID=5486 RepID=A0A367YIH4_9ASCO|nr:hypothetical protein Cantr_01101 [Candida viswanathii]